MQNGGCLAVVEADQGNIDGDELYVRSHRGRAGGWFRRGLAAVQGHIWVDARDRAVGFLQEQDDDSRDAIDQAYRTKYARFGRSYVDPMVSRPPQRRPCGWCRSIPSRPSRRIAARTGVLHPS